LDDRKKVVAFPRLAQNHKEKQIIIGDTQSIIVGVPEATVNKLNHLQAGQVVVAFW
tara:strand:+ start:401 stop:568 length:168 start_codon:yes stop_codon:yes gene_type:complete